MTVTRVCTDPGCFDYAAEGTHTHPIVVSCMAPWCGIDGRYGNPGVCNAPGGHKHKGPAAAEGEAQTMTDTEDRLREQAIGRAAEIEEQVAEITAWWRDLANTDAVTTAPKAVEYGASDLAIMGKAMEGLFPNLSSQPAAERERIGLEMATAFYALGKVARLFGAYQQGRLPGEDSWFDLTVYSMMARRIRQTGRWVG